ncbi:unnamed protein product [Linum trigynum]|uniref:Uncharacterized protein n=1 Tax=Linum trigynum TaxID=586398 RepID=A0AAV2FZI8_9ROSI
MLILAHSSGPDVKKPNRAQLGLTRPNHNRSRPIQSDHILSSRPQQEGTLFKVGIKKCSNQRATCGSLVCFKRATLGAQISSTTWVLENGSANGPDLLHTQWTSRIR